MFRVDSKHIFNAAASLLEQRGGGHDYDNTALLQLAARLEFSELAYLDPVKWNSVWIRTILDAIGYIEISL